MTFQDVPRVLEEVDDSTRLYELVLFIDTNVLHLLFGCNQMLSLNLLYSVSPLVAQLLDLIA